MAPRQQVSFLRLTEAERKTFANIICEEIHPKEGSPEEMLCVMIDGASVFTDFGMRVPLGAGAAFDAVLVPPGRPASLELFHGPPGPVAWKHVCGARNIAAVFAQPTIDKFNNGGTAGHRSPVVT